MQAPITKLLKSQILTSVTRASTTEFPSDSQPGRKEDKNVQISIESTNKNQSCVPLCGEGRSERGKREMVSWLHLDIPLVTLQEETDQIKQLGHVTVSVDPTIKLIVP